MPQLKFQVDRRRLLIDVTVFGPEPTSFDGFRAKALIDTGATVSGVGPAVITALDLISYGKRPLGSATEERMVAYYLFRVGLPLEDIEKPAWPHIFERVDGFSWARPMAFDVILGMDVLAQCALRMESDGRCVLTFGE